MANSGSALKTILIIIAIFVFGFILLIGIGVYSAFSSVEDEDAYTSSLSSGGKKIGIVEINSEIISSDYVVKLVNEFKKSSSIKALVVRVNSPGGGVAASQEMYESIKSFRESGRPVVISMGGVAASGGYYLSLGGSKIMANPGTVTGSIGVILQVTQLKPLMDKVGVDIKTVKSGKFKDSGSPFRPLTEEDQAYFQNVIDDSYDQFVSAVVEERKLDRSKVLSLAQGQVFTGRQAFKAGLVDTLGTYDDAIKYAAALSGISGEPETVKKRKDVSILEKLLGESEVESISSVRDMLTSKSLIQYKLQ